MSCATCGAPLPDQAMFCGECGSAAHPWAPRDEPGAAASAPVVDGAAGERVVPEERAVPGEGAISGKALPGEGAVSGEGVPEKRAAPEDATRFAARRTTAVFTLHFSTGETVSVTGSGLVGRRPVAQPGEYFDEYVVVDDPGRSVSKTHLEFGQEGGAFWISDRFSANGTVVREPDRSPRLCPGGRRTRVARGSRIDIGEQFFIVA